MLELRLVRAEVSMDLAERSADLASSLRKTLGPGYDVQDWQGVHRGAWPFIERALADGTP